MKLSFVIAALLLMTANAQSQDVKRVEVIEYGLYSVDKTFCNRDSQGIERCDRSNVRHAATTWNVPAQLGVEFGLRYRVVGAPIGSQVDIKRVWLLPPPGFRSPSADKPIERLERTDRTVIGQSTFVSYGFDDRWELVPGPWILEFWHKGQKLGQQRFIVQAR